MVTLVPFTETGNMIRSVCQYSTNHNVIYKEGKPFTSWLEIKAINIIRSGFEVILEGDVTYFMSSAEFSKMLNKTVIDHGRVYGTWGFKKQGEYYSLVYL